MTAPVSPVVQVEVIRSSRRRKTVSARQRDGVLRVSIPATMTAAEERHWVAEMERRFARKHRADGVDLDERARRLAAAHRLPAPRSIRWVDNQHNRWGSCTPADRSIRVSTRVAAFPPWVVDYVIVHELAHLVEAGHGPAFHALVARYPRSQRAIGYLMAKGMEIEEPD